MTDADQIAITALGWLAGEPEQLSRFLALTGSDVSDLRRNAASPGFLAGVLDFLMGHEPTLLAFCSASDLDPNRVVHAAHMLCGPPQDGGY
ncbi:Protein of unknown function [Rhizobium sp. RU20A]|uniref:DUF3572 domain-containing protein n=1 Tax=Rhizobium sp. RU20A TaxID=1907412 RepID=UPI00095678FB|nr:DUF3572 domain-containing protein [Rhizobium sp. RU20A]SIP97901.1 Protein of unknown function [Rhizobium sp. RU20A]